MYLVVDIEFNELSLCRLLTQRMGDKMNDIPNEVKITIEEPTEQI